MSDHAVASTPPRNRRLIDFVSGLAAGVISVIVCNPLDITRTRLNVLTSPSHRNDNPKYTHFSHAMETIWREEGWKGFYTGFRTNVIAIPLFHSIFFPLYEFTKAAAIKREFSPQSSYLLATLTAGTICNVVTNPIWVIRTRLMAQYLHHEDNQYKTTSPIAVMKQMYRKEGIQSLFKGLVPSIFSVSNAMVYFTCYEHIKALMGPTPTVLNVFVSSTFSKIIATTLTYPIVVIRTVQFDHRGTSKSSLSSIGSHIIRENGFSGFYAGLKPDLIRLIPSNAIVFIVYEYLKRFL